MRKHFLWIICALVVFSVSVIKVGVAGVAGPNALKDSTAVKAGSRNASAIALFTNYVDEIYNAAGLEQTGLDASVFQQAITGFYNLKNNDRLPSSSSVITIVDFHKASSSKRMWIVDLLNRKLILNTYVAHGQGSGDNVATAFSNNEESHQSSLGFYVTDDIYMGKHGRSLRLDGMDQGFNDKARSRDIVLHAADYVSEATIAQLGRLGRSFGCPAVSPVLVDQIIDLVKGKNMLFMTGNDSSYASKYLDEDQAAKMAFNDSSFNLAKEAFAN